MDQGRTQGKIGGKNRKKRENGREREKKGGIGALALVD